MSFSVKIIFNGLCGYVPDKELNYREGEPPQRMTILMPNAGVGGKKVRALDGRKLRKHYPLLKFFAKNIYDKGSIPEEAEMQWHLEGMEVTFEIEEACPGLNKFVVVQDLSAEQAERSREDFNWGVHLQEIAPDFAKVDPIAFSEFDNQEERLISSRVVVTEGRLSTHDLETTVYWKFDATLGGDFEQRPLSHAVALDFEHLTKLTICARFFGGECVRRLVLVGEVDEIVRVDIGNLCEKCFFPVDDDLSFDLSNVREDKDFRWFFELCENACDIPAELEADRSSLPIPKPDSIQGGGGFKTVECMRVTYPAYQPEENLGGEYA